MSEDDIKFYEIVKRKELQVNDKWYLLDKNWFQKWSDTVKNKFSTDQIKQIENSRLLDKDRRVCGDKLLAREFELVPEEVWEYLIETYGLDCPEDHSLFERRVIENHSDRIVELEPLTLTISVYGKECMKTATFSAAQTLNDLYMAVENEFLVKKPLRILQKMDNNTFDIIDQNPSIRLGDIGLKSNEHIYIDHQTGTDGQWLLSTSASKSCRPQTTATKSSSSSSGSASSSNGASRHTPLSSTPLITESGHVKGVCGLCNLGNTCFMNSGLQCISNVPPLTYYFIRDYGWKRDLNPNNPLGMHGRLAERYQQLLEQIWIKNSNYFVPRDFKIEVAKFAPQFSGYAQHDSQELMMFLLDGLHEDLNRIQQKPYQESNDADDDKPILVKAQEAWNYHKMRNDSVIVEYFHGLLKSTVVCPDCNYVSVTFDAFGSLSLPLVVCYPQEFSVRFYDLKNQIEIVSAKVMVSKGESVKDFIDKIKLLFPVLEKSVLTVFEMQENEIKRNFMLRDSVGLLKDINVMVFELPLCDDKYEWMQMKMCTEDESVFGSPIMVRICKNDIDWYSIKNVIFSRLPFLNRIFGQKTNYINDELIDPKSVQQEFDKISKVFQIYFSDKSAHKSPTPLNLDSRVKYFYQEKYEIKMKWSKEGKDKFYDSSIDQVYNHESMNLEQRPLNIETCVNEFIRKEKLGINDLWYCKKCKAQKAASKKFDLWQLPRVLILHLKRFRSGSYRRDKIDTFVEFPLTDLDLSDFVTEAHRNACKDGYDEPFLSTTTNREIYDLVAVSNHMGGLGGGHYTAYAKNFIDNNWYLFDDSHTSKISPENVQTKAAYVLVYVSKSVLEQTREKLYSDMNEDRMDCDE